MIRLPIDTKSLYLNILNDNQSGHTATVATPIRQGSSVNEELNSVFEIPDAMNQSSKGNLICKILATSRAEATILKVCRFNKIKVNGQPIATNSEFCMYVREETGKTNVHCGRQKLHYPMSLKYVDEYVDIDNKKVMNAISETICHYAFIVEAFEYEEDSQYLNFDLVIVGEQHIPYSKVFLNKRGVGNKFTTAFNEYADTYDAEIIALRKHLGYDAVNPENYIEVEENNRLLAVDRMVAYLSKFGNGKIRQLTTDYPYALYDIEMVQDGRKHYYIVRFTSTKQQYFSLSANKIRFCQDFSSDVSVILFTDINGKIKMYTYSVEEINAMSKRFNSITFEKRGE